MVLGGKRIEFSKIGLGYRYSNFSLVCSLIFSISAFLIFPQLSIANNVPQLEMELMSAEQSDSGVVAAEESSSGNAAISPAVPCNPEDPLKLHFPAYGTYPAGYYPFIAEHFKFIIIQSDAAAAGIKSANPNDSVVYYTTPILSFPNDPNWSVITGNESWFMHDSSGNRIQYRPSWSLPAGSGWLMDPRSQGWRNFFAASIISKVSSTSYDGTFGDIVFEQLYPSDFSSSPPTDRLLAWHGDMQAFLQNVKQQLGSVLFVVNTFDLASFPQATDGMMLEQFCHAPWMSASQHFSVGEWQDQVNALAAISANNKWFLAQSGATSSNSAILQYCLGSYLLGKKSDFGTFHFAPNSYLGLYYYAEYIQLEDLKIGNPVGDYYQQGSTQVFARNFENGLVLVNPTWETKTVSLDHAMKKLDGTMVSSVTLSPHTSAILGNVIDGCCGDGVIDENENCSNCPQDVTCFDLCCNGQCMSPICITDSQCNDGNPTTCDDCISGGSCNAECVHTPNCRQRYPGSPSQAQISSLRKNLSLSNTP